MRTVENRCEIRTAVVPSANVLKRSKT